MPLRCLPNTRKQKYLEIAFKYELPFLDKVNSSSDPSEILILQSPISRAFLPPSRFLSKFDIAN